MSEFNLGRLSYDFKGPWESGKDYNRDDVVSLSGKSYVCLIGHTSSPVFSDDLNAVLPDSDPPQPQPRWVLMTQGTSFRGNWTPGSEYNLGEAVYYKGSVWTCEVAHVSSVFSQDRDNWGFVAQHIDYLGDWTSGDDYVEGSLVKYNGVVYRCVIAHTAGSRLEDDQENWRVFHRGIEYRGTWEPGQTYRPDDLVRYGASVFRCIQTHESQPNSTEIDAESGEEIEIIGFDSDKFQIEFLGFQFESQWSSTNYYQEGDVVRYGGVLWVAMRPNYDSDPFRLPDDSTLDWSELTSTLNFRGEWNLGTEYRKGDVVQRGGQLFRALRDVDRNDGEGSVADYLDPDWWELLLPGSKFAGEWDADKLYSVGDIVYFLGTAYRCNFEHYSDNTNFPGDNGNIYDYWDIVIQAGQPGGLQEKGDLLSYGLNRTIVGDGSTEGPIDVPIGEEEQYLSVNDELEVFWRHRIQESDQIFVSNNGVDDQGADRNRGLVPHRPFQTIRYAAEYVSDNFLPGELVTIRVFAGDFEEISPITIPAGCAVVGDELRTTTVRPNRPLEAYQNDFQYVREYLDQISNFILPVLSNEEIEPTSLNNEPQLLDTTTTDLDGVNNVLSLINEYVDYIDAKLNGTNNEPIVSGSNVPREQENIVNAGLALLENTRFIETELWARIQEEYPNINFDRLRVRNDVFALLRGIARDLKYSGNYATLLAAQRYVNAVQGSTDKDLFWVRDTTGIRSLTTKGLIGELEAQTAGRRYRRPDGGAYVALDPGWGPEDERTWIANRSPYIQGVTTIGTGCVGKRVDGRLHNGGNRSMVSNDFTQVLSDGIGVWVSDNARTELVSVFTYYNSVGYLTERGGIIRATNGNNSYGRYGSVARGNDPTETPQTVSVFNRNNEAQVLQGFAGGENDAILAFEYSNAGEQYTEADADIEGAGDFADVEYTDFRDGALFESRIINTRGSGVPGGANYLVRQGFAQETLDATSTIFLASSDDNAIDAVYEGQRILIIAGTGTGQYGYIDTYNPPSKEATIRRESDGELGWDHIIPGTPIETVLDTTAQYRIEPRIDTNHPGFSAESGVFSEAADLKAFCFGTTSAVFENVEIGQGSGILEGITGVEAQFTVERNGKDYTAILTEPGAGYAVGDRFTILGSDLDGVTPDNDLEVIVTEVTDDSTNSIVDFDTRGIGRGGRFVALSNDTAYYSDDGDNWLQAPLPFIGNDYSAIAAGNDRFVAIAQAENRVARSLDGETWSIESLPSQENWSDIVYGKDRWVMISDNSNFVQYSTDGETWLETEIPEDTVSDSTGDSTVSSYTHLVYGKGQYVAVSSSDRATATSLDGVTWTRHNEAIIDKGSEYLYDFAGFQYGDNRYLAVCYDGVTTYSFDGITWYQGTSVAVGSDQVISLRFAQGVFFVIYGTPGSQFNTVATTEDGLLWKYRTLNFSEDWQFAEYGYIGNSHKWKVLANNSTNQETVYTGKQAKLRADVFQGQFQTVKIWDPGSGYTPDNTVELTITDSSYTVAVETQSRLGDGVLPQPDFINRGSGYRSSTSTITVTGDGYADIIPEDEKLILSGIQEIPGVGVQIRIDGIFREDEDGELTDDRLLFTAATVKDLGDDGTGNGTRLIEFQIRPDLENENNLEHGTTASLRSRYSQVRITNHDFLDIGTGNFNQTSYPDIYADGAFFAASPENEVLEEQGGRVFYVSTDQDGNFRGGDLFAVEQATGVITISADFFDFSGLSELALGGIRLGGSGTIVREFSTDPTFSADSDNVVPTQRAILEFLESRLSVGGQDIETNDLLAGRVQVGTSENRIANSANEYLRVTTDADFNGLDEFGNPSSVGGTWISFQQFLGTDKNDNMQ